MYAIIGGTGFEKGFEGEGKTIETIYGKVSYLIDKDIIYLSRHGRDHECPPHLINYRANIRALKDLGVEFIFSTSAVGSMNEDFRVGDLVLLKDFLDFTINRKKTFYEESVGHVKMDSPYCPHLNNMLREGLMERKFPYKGEAVYVATEGPRFETAAEIKFYKQIGADVVGMTNVPEVSLAKELGMCYASVGIITNWATGFGSETNIDEIASSTKASKEQLLKLFLDIFSQGIRYEDCNCKDELILL